MPLETIQKTLQTETLRGFLGVNLRRDRLSLEDFDLARSINADLHLKAGAVVVRRGRSKQFTTALTNTEVRRIARHNSRRYQVAGAELYRAQTSILAGLSTNNVTTLLPFRPLNDTTIWEFIADDNTMQKDDGTNIRNWGIASPSSGPTTAIGAAGSLTGAYNAQYTYARLVGSTVVHESNPSAAGVSRTLSSETLDISITASTDGQVTNIRIYRTAAGGSSYLFDQQVANSTTTINSSQADSALGTAVETDNDEPKKMSWVADFQNHVWGCRDASNPHYLWYSKRFRPEAFPSTQFLEVGNPDDALQCAVPLAGFLGVFSRDTKYRVFGNITSGFAYLEALSSRGTPAPNAVIATSRGAVFPARDGIWITTFLQPDQELSQSIEPLFHGQSVNGYAPVDWDQAVKFSMAEYKNRLYFGYVDTDGTDMLAVLSHDTGRWYHYELPARSLHVEEDNDTLTMGATDGFVYVLEDADATGDAGNDITASVEFADREGRMPGIRKMFQYLRTDIDAKSGSVTLEFYLDETLRTKLSVTGGRTRKLLRLPPRMMGHTWRVAATYTGTEQPEIHSIQAMYLPMAAA